MNSLSPSLILARAIVLFKFFYDICIDQSTFLTRNNVYKKNNNNKINIILKKSEDLLINLRCHLSRRNLGIRK